MSIAAARTSEHIDHRPIQDMLRSMGRLVFGLVVTVVSVLPYYLSYFDPYISFLVGPDFIRIYSVVFLRVVIIEIDSGLF